MEEDSEKIRNKKRNKRQGEFTHLFFHCVLPRLRRFCLRGIWDDTDRI